MNKINILIFTIVLLTLSSRAFSQYEENKSSEAVNWTILQLIPNPAFIQETDKDNARLLFALRWEVTPINYSFSANKFISPLQFFKINPVRRFAGSAELFVQPEWTTGNFKYASFDRFGVSSGIRIVLPLREKGESLAFSIGAKANYRKDYISNDNTFIGVEEGIYFLGGMVGLQLNQNFSSQTKYNFSLYIKYF